LQNRIAKMQTSPIDSRMDFDTLSWDDIKIALALTRHPTMAAAAQALHVHQSTVSRRIHTLEERLGLRLFVTSETGIVMTEAGRTLARHAEEMAEIARALSANLEDNRDDDRQSVRISAVSTFISAFLHNHVESFLSTYPNIRLDFVGEERNAVLERREADIAIRHARPTGGQAITRKLTDIATAAYAVTNLTDKTGHLLIDAPWVGFSRPLDYLPEQQWIDAHVPPHLVGLTFAATATYTNAVARGLGAGLLSCMVGDQTKGLVRIAPGDPIMWREGWLMVLDDVRQRPAVRCVIDWLTSVCADNKELFSGNTISLKETQYDD
jgi:DNA-binding transcriptional LysR family regulator